MTLVAFSPQTLAAATGAQVWSHGDPDAQLRLATDSRQLRPGDVFVPLTGERFDGHSFLPQVLALPDVGALVARSHRHELSARDWEGRWVLVVEDPLTALGDAAAWVRSQRPIPVVGVTGTSGKTTTREMVRCALTAGFERVYATQGNFNNLVGVPLTLLEMPEGQEVAVLELGMSFPGEIARLAEICRPNVRLITNVGRAHLEVLKDEDGVARAKGELFATARAGDVLIVNLDDARISNLPRPEGTRVVTFGRHRGAQVRLLDTGEHSGSFQVDVLGQIVTCRPQLPGAHNRLNATSALAVAHALGIDPARAALAVGQARPPGMRQREEEWRGVRVINDAYNANPLSMAAALDTLATLRAGGATHAALGDMRELGPLTEQSHVELGEKAARSGLDGLWALGQSAPHVVAGARAAGMPEGLTRAFADAQELATHLRQVLRPGDVLLVKGSRGMKMETVLEALRAPDITARGEEGAP